MAINEVRPQECCRLRQTQRTQTSAQLRRFSLVPGTTQPQSNPLGTISGSVFCFRGEFYLELARWDYVDLSCSTNSGTFDI